MCVVNDIKRSSISGQAVKNTQQVPCIPYQHQGNYRSVSLQSSSAAQGNHSSIFACINIAHISTTRAFWVWVNLGGHFQCEAVSLYDQRIMAVKDVATPRAAIACHVGMSFTGSIHDGKLEVQPGHSLVAGISEHMCNV